MPEVLELEHTPIYIITGTSMGGECILEGELAAVDMVPKIKRDLKTWIL